MPNSSIASMDAIKAMMDNVSKVAIIDTWHNRVFVVVKVGTPCRYWCSETGKVIEGPFKPIDRHDVVGDDLYLCRLNIDETEPRGFFNDTNGENINMIKRNAKSGMSTYALYEPVGYSLPFITVE